MEPKDSLDKKGELISQTRENVLVSNDFNPIVFFKKDKNFVFAHQKIEKLSAAVYMLTSFLSQEEPIKWSLRNLSTNLLRLNIDLKRSSLKQQEEIESSIRNSVLEIVSLLEVATFAGLVSDMNLTILKKEFHSLLGHIDKMLAYKKTGDNSVLNGAFFAVNDNNFPDQELTQKLYSPMVDNNIKDNSENVHKVVSEQNLEVPKQEVIKDKSQVSATKSNKLKEYGPVAIKKNKRQGIIINLLKRKKEIMVKDVSEVVRDCSEKTLQRELMSLVSQGILRKEGERRWTKYSLA